MDDINKLLLTVAAGAVAAGYVGYKLAGDRWYGVALPVAGAWLWKKRQEGRRVR
jgi:hypothetical protein